MDNWFKKGADGIGGDYISCILAWSTLRLLTKVRFRLIESLVKRFCEEHQNFSLCSASMKTDKKLSRQRKMNFPFRRVFSTIT